MPQAPVLLYAEDESADVFFLREAFGQGAPQIRVHAVPTGREAVAYLAGDGEFADRAAYPIPFAVLLDIKMPGMTGFEALEWIRSRRELDRLPVYILSSSSLSRDQAQAARLGADGYVVKPLDCRDLIHVVRALARHLPGGAPPAAA